MKILTIDNEAINLRLFIVLGDLFFAGKNSFNS